MPFKSKAQQRWMYSAEQRGELPKGTAKKWSDHTPAIKKLPERVKKAYDTGVLYALKLAGTEQAKDAPQTTGETRLKRNHEPHDFFAVKRMFARAGTKKKETGKHVNLKDQPKEEVPS